MSFRKTITSILLIAILINSIGYVGIFGFLRWQITHKISELIEHHDEGRYTKLVLPVSAYDQSNPQLEKINAHEFRYKGNMYDIVSQKRIGDTIHFIVIHDLRDQANFHRLAVASRLQSQTSSGTHSGKANISGSVLKDLFAPIFTNKIPQYTSLFTATSVITSEALQLPKTPFLPVPVPPPKNS